MKLTKKTADVLKGFVDIVIAEASEEQALYILSALRIACKVAMEHEDEIKHGK